MEIQHLFFPVHPTCQEQSALTTAGSPPLPILNLLPHTLLPSFPPLSPPSPSLQNPWLAHHFSLLLSAGPWRAGGLTAGQLMTADLWQGLHGVSALQLATNAFLATKGLMSLASWRLGWNPAGWFDPAWGIEGFTPRCGRSEQCLYVLLPQGIRARLLLQPVGLVEWLKKETAELFCHTLFWSFLLSIRLGFISVLYPHCISRCSLHRVQEIHPSTRPGLDWGSYSPSQTWWDIFSLYPAPLSYLQELIYLGHS